MKERLNYIFTENTIVGTTVNMPLICQAESIDDLKIRMKEMAKIYIKDLQEWINSDEPFELKELNQEQWRSLK